MLTRRFTPHLALCAARSAGRSVSRHPRSQQAITTKAAQQATAYSSGTGFHEGGGGGLWPGRVATAVAVASAAAAAAAAVAVGAEKDLGTCKAEVSGCICC